MRDCYIYLYSMLTWQENELWLLKWLKKFMYVTYIHIIQFWLDWRELSNNAFQKIKITLNSLQRWKIFNIWPHQLCKNMLEFLSGWLNLYFWSRETLDWHENVSTFWMKICTLNLAFPLNNRENVTLNG